MHVETYISGSSHEDRGAVPSFLKKPCVSAAAESLVVTRKLSLILRSRNFYPLFGRSCIKVSMQMKWEQLSLLWCPTAGNKSISGNRVELFFWRVVGQTRLPL